MAFLWILAGCSGCSDCSGGVDPQGPTALGGNVLIVLVDDIGVDKVGAWGEHPAPAPTPNIDALAASGVRFRHAFGQPVCSPARAALLTGRTALQTGIGSTVRPDTDRFDLPDGEITIPEMLRGSPIGPWSSGMIGKWHLSSLDEAGARGPLDQGFDRFLGILENPGFAVHPDGEPMDYDHWEKSTDGELGVVRDYLVTAQTDDALALMAELPEPWVLYVAYSGAHLPLHSPPAELWSEAVPDSSQGTIDAMIEALDAEIGRLLSEVDDHTTVVFAADNGTVGHGVRPPAEPRRAKDTLYDGGVRVPLVIAGPLVEAPGTTVEAMVHLVDVFATVADIAGVELGSLGRPIDGISLIPWLSDPEREGRECLVLDQFPFNGDPSVELDRSAREDDWLLLRPHDGPEELYRRSDGAPWLGPDLLADRLEPDAQEALGRLRRAIDRADP